MADGAARSLQINFSAAAVGYRNATLVSGCPDHDQWRVTSTGKQLMSMDTLQEGASLEEGKAAHRLSLVGTHEPSSLIIPHAAVAPARMNIVSSSESAEGVHVLRTVERHERYGIV